MPASSAVKKKHAQRKNIDEMLNTEYLGYANFIIGKVKKFGREKVLNSNWNINTGGSEYYWLKKEYERLLDYAQDIYLRRIPQSPLVDQSQHKHFNVTVEIDEKSKVSSKSAGHEDKPSSLSGRNISEYIEI